MHHNGRRQKRRVGPTQADERRAQKLADQVNAALILGQYRPEGHKREAVPFDDFAQLWMRSEVRLPIERKEAGALAPSNADGYESHLDTHLVPYFRSKDLALITPGEVQAFRDHCVEQGRPRSPRTLDLVLGTLRHILAHARVRGFVERNAVEE